MNFAVFDVLIKILESYRPQIPSLPTEIVRRCLNNYARPVVQRQTMRVNAPLQRGANFKIDSHILGLLSTDNMLH